MFTYSCYIKNPSKETINKLISIGYRMIKSQDNPTNEPQEYLYAQLGKLSYETKRWCMQNNSAIYCDKHKEALFTAIASICDDRPNFQWYRADKECYDYCSDGNCNVYIYKDEFYYAGEEYEDDLMDLPSYFHKATVQELIEHYNKENYTIYEHY